MNRAILKINIEQKDPERLLTLLIVDENLSTASLYREQIGLPGVVGHAFSRAVTTLVPSLRIFDIRVTCIVVTASNRYSMLTVGRDHTWLVTWVSRFPPLGKHLLSKGFRAENPGQGAI